MYTVQSILYPSILHTKIISKLNYIHLSLQVTRSTLPPGCTSTTTSTSTRSPTTTPRYSVHCKVDCIVYSIVYSVHWSIKYTIQWAPPHPGHPGAGPPEAGDPRQRAGHDVPHVRVWAGAALRGGGEGLHEVPVYTVQPTVYRWRAPGSTSSSSTSFQSGGILSRCSVQIVQCALCSVQCAFSPT